MSEELLLASDDECEPRRHVFPQHNPNATLAEVILEVGMVFETVQQFKDAVRKYNIRFGREVFFIKREPHRSRAIFYSKTCPWKVYCSRKKFSQAFQIKKLVDEHIYARKNKSRLVKSYWVAEMLKGQLRINGVVQD
ncbi:hypothetical protein S83_070217 [Arachis hypogaea]